VRITLAEDPVESYLSTRKPAAEPSPDSTDWVSILKWVAFIFVLLQLFWWVVPALHR
jgi:hypothetical protein